MITLSFNDWQLIFGQKQVNVNTLQSSFQITSRISKSNQAPLSAVPKMEDSGQ
ncbi:hypothetical protein AB4514_08225 [Vibrio cyclitrophicus]